LSIHVSLECLSAPHQGKRLKVTPSKPLIIKTQKSDANVGEVVVEIKDTKLQLANRSRMVCLLNGVHQQHAALTNADILVVGKQTFRVIIDGDDNNNNNVSTESIDRDVGLAGGPKVACSVCDAVFSGRDQQFGFVRGNQRICFTCLSKGVNPDHLPRPEYRTPPPGLIEIGPEDLDSIPTEIARRKDSEPEQPGVSIAAPGKPGSMPHRSKRISASQPAQRGTKALEPKKKNLLAKMSGMFGRKDAVDKDKLKELEEQRQVLLREAGRLSLSQQGGPNIPDRHLAKVLKGAQVTIQLQDFTIAALEQWRNQRQRLSYLDAEITALRKKLHLKADPELSPVEPHLRADQRARQERAFEAMDGLMTENLDSAAQEQVETKATPTKPPAKPREDSAAFVRSRKMSEGRRRRRRP
jgi:hypothetical protein